MLKTMQGMWNVPSSFELLYAIVNLYLLKELISHTNILGSHAWLSEIILYLDK